MGNEYGLDMLDLSIGGHIHADPAKNDAASVERQMRISEERAQALADKIEEAGVPNKHLQTVGYGGQKPVGTPEDNRRVEIYLKTGDSQTTLDIDFPDMATTQVGKLFLGEDASQRPWKIGRGNLKFAKEAKMYTIDALRMQT